MAHSGDWFNFIVYNSQFEQCFKVLTMYYWLLNHLQINLSIDGHLFFLGLLRNVILLFTLHE